MFRSLAVATLALCLLPFVSACGPTEAELKAQAVADSLAAVAQKRAADSTARMQRLAGYDRYWNDLSRLLAGLPPEPGSSLSRFESLPPAQLHRQQQDQAWQKKRANQLDSVAAWAARELPEGQAASTTVFYPFSGPDLLTLYAIYPHAPRYVFFGYETEGTLADVRQMNDQQVATNLANLRQSLAQILELTYFKTNEMKVDFKNVELSGPGPALMAFLARYGRRILHFEHVTVDEKGQVQPMPTPIPADKQDPSDAQVTGIRILFQDAENPLAQEQVLYYWSVNVSDNEGFTQKTNYHTYLRSLAPTLTYFKAASYLPHKDYFRTVSNLTLEISDLITQDDSGIPWRFYTADKWNTTLYGKYVGPIDLFKTWFQTDLDKAYKDAAKNGTLRPLNFGIGYARFKGSSLLWVARKRK